MGMHSRVFITALLSCVWACGDILKVDSGALEVAPNELLFPPPAPGSDSRRLGVELTNTGRGPLIIATIALEENDGNQELALVDADDWQQPRTIEPDESDRVFVEWVATDAQADQGRLTITHNSGPPTVVPIRTTDIDPCIRVVSDPPGIEGDGELTVELNQAVAGSFQRVIIEVNGDCIAPLDIQRICLERPGEGRDGDCSGSLGQFVICDDIPDSPVGCAAPEQALPKRLIQGTNYRFSAFFEPPEDNSSTLGADVRIATNATLNSQFKVKLRGTVCVRRQPGDICQGCGDGEIGPGEQCDDGNVNDEDDCRNTCMSATCGDGIVSNGETCDDANQIDTDTCRNDCTAARCGDGVVQTDVEQCDDGNEDNQDACLNTCVIARCGDGVQQTDVEACDDGNAVDTDGCLNNCELAACGDGVVQDGLEECDDANENDTDACRNSCELARCGDGVVQANVEPCDDGNLDDTDACLSTCQIAACGDGFV